MSITQKTVEVKAGDSLSSIALDVLGDYTQWRELAYFNDLDNFADLKVGTILNIPIKEEVEKSISLVNSRIDEFTDVVELRIKEITDSRVFQSVTKILGVDTSSLLAELDLSSIADKLKATVSSVNDWQLIQWLL